MKRLIPLDLKVCSWIGFALGIFCCSIWPVLLQFPYFSLAIAVLLILRPLYLMLSWKSTKHYPWFEKQLGKFKNN